MSIGDSDKTSKMNEIIGTCPCLRYIDGLPVCICGDSLEEVELFNVHPDLSSQIGMGYQATTDSNPPMCLGCVRIGLDGIVQCVSQDKPIIIRDKVLTASQLEEALDSFPHDMFSSEQDICNECLYKVLVSLILTVEG